MSSDQQCLSPCETPAVCGETVQRQMKIEIREIGIPPRPQILTQIEKEMTRDEPDFIQLARLISQDVGLSAGMIKVANSPYFTFGKKVRTVQESLLVLGLKLVIKAVSSLSLQRAFEHVPNMEQFWEASARVAETAAMVARELGRAACVRPEDAHTFGLFRDCGIPMLMIPFPEYRLVLEAANAETSRLFTDPEDDAYGLNHAQLGAQLAEDWLLPLETGLAIRHHHDPRALSGELDIPAMSVKMIAIAQLAEHLVQLDAGQAASPEWLRFGAACLKELGLAEGDLPDLAATCIAGTSGTSGKGNA